MKNLQIIIVLMVLGLVLGCQSQESDFATFQENVSQNINHPQQITEEVNSAEVNNILSTILGKNVKSRTDSYNITLLNDSVGNPAIISINYSNNGGWALISATKNYHPVLAYNAIGNFQIGNEAPPVSNVWLDNTIAEISKSAHLPLDSLAKIHHAWRKYENEGIATKNQSKATGHDRLYDISQSEYEILKKIYLEKMNELRSQGYRVYMIDDYPGTTSFGDDLESFMEGRIYPMYSNDYWAISFVAEKDYWKTISANGHVMQTTWTQDCGYNQAFPTLSNGELALVGCGPVAVGQILYYYKYPTTFDWTNMTKTGYGNLTTSKFLYDVALKCDADFKIGRTSVTTQDMQNALNSYGYTYTKSGFDVNKLTNNTPAIMTSKLNNTNGHAWIVEGYTSYQEYTEIEIWSFTLEEYLEQVYSETTAPVSSKGFYVNWGWGGMSDGYYSILQNAVPSGYTSNKMDEMIYSIKRK